MKEKDNDDKYMGTAIWTEGPDCNPKGSKGYVRYLSRGYFNRPCGCLRRELH